jgi:hypothetical protein
MTTTQRLVGYDRGTDLVAEEFPIAVEKLPRARELAHVPADDPDVTGCYRLSAEAARELAWIIEARVDPDRKDYFLEGFAG